MAILLFICGLFKDAVSSNRVDGRIPLRPILKKSSMRIGIGFCSRHGASATGHGNSRFHKKRHISWPDEQL